MNTTDNKDVELEVLATKLQCTLNTTSMYLEFLANQDSATAHIVQRLFYKLLALYKDNLAKTCSTGEMELTSSLYEQALRGLQISMLLNGATRAEVLALYEINRLMGGTDANNK